MPRGDAKPAGRADHERRLAAAESAAEVAGLVPGRGLTTAELARRYRVGEDRVRGWIKSGKLKAVNTADVGCARPRYVATPEAVAEFEQTRSAAPPPKPTRRRRRPEQRDFFPGD